MCPNQPLHIHALAGGLALPDLERDGQSKVRLRVVDGDPPTANDWLALNPFTISNHHKAAIPQLLWSHAFLIASNGIASRIGFLRANRQRFFSWKRIASEDKPPLLQPNSAHIPSFSELSVSTGFTHGLPWIHAAKVISAAAPDAREDELADTGKTGKCHYSEANGAVLRVDCMS